MGLPSSLRVRLAGNLATMKKTTPEFGPAKGFSGKLILPLANTKKGKQVKNEMAKVQNLSKAKTAQKELALRALPREEQCLKVILSIGNVREMLITS
jgi:hypothetical protein